jgi:signal transduction histidine kinase
MRHRLAADAVAAAVLAAVYYGAGRIGLELAYLDGAVAALWPPAGVGLAALYLYGPRLWPGVVVGDLLLGDFSTPLGTVLGQTLGNTVSVLVAAIAMRRLLGGRADLARVRDVLAVVACCVIAAVVSACFGPTSLWLGDVIAGDEVGRVFRTWFLSDLSGALVVTPLLVTWLGSRHSAPDRRTAVEGAVLIVLLVALAEVPPQRDVPYMVFPVLLWAAVRFGPTGAATAVAIVSSLSVWNTSRDAGPFVRDSITDSLLASQLFIATAALTSLILAAVTAERREAQRLLVESERAQRALADEQTALRRVATMVASEAAPSRLFELVTEEVARHLDVSRASVLRYEIDGTATVLGSWGTAEEPGLGVGSQVTLEGDTVVTAVQRTGLPQRVEDYSESSGRLAETLRNLGYQSAVAAPVHFGGRLWGVLVAATRSGRLAPGLEQRLCDFADLLAQALANADAHDKLAASRARVVEAGDAERRRLERNLHDGAQQRLVSLALQLRMARAKLDAEPVAAKGFLANAQGELDTALDELRELARGIHPAVLTDRGLGPAVEALAGRSPVPVEVGEMPEERLPKPVEVAVYYVVAEAITNVAKYAGASHVTVTVTRSDGSAVVDVVDDGQGGADPARGSGLRGLSDRVESLNGRFQVESARDGGTRIRAEIPV